MEEILLHLPYFGPVSHFREIVKPAVIWFENEDNYQKQTYRNRTYIYGANGKLLLNIPVKHLISPGVKQHQKYKDVRVENDFKWQQQHWKSLKSAYQASPFFEYYEDDLAPLFLKKEKYLMEFNYKCFHLICDLLKLEVNYKKTEEYFRDPEMTDKRFLINAKQNREISEYNQVFQEKKGFLHDLSILDLIFNEGPASVNYLKEMQIPE